MYFQEAPELHKRFRLYLCRNFSPRQLIKVFLIMCCAPKRNNNLKRAPSSNHLHLLINDCFSVFLIFGPLLLFSLKVEYNRFQVYIHFHVFIYVLFGGTDCMFPC